MIMPRFLGVALICLATGAPAWADEAEQAFVNPPAAARPWVYWFWKNGNITREGITADLEAMQRVGVGGVILMEVALTTPRGAVPFFSEPWRDLFRRAVAEADRLGLQVCVNSGPGWTGSGGPWIKPEQSMQKVVAGEVTVTGPGRFDQTLPQPESVQGFYRDIAVLAFPAPGTDYRIADIEEKALYRRGPYSSQPGVRPAFPSPAKYEVLQPDQRIPADRIIDLTAKMDSAGRLAWDVPDGRWTIVRFGHTSTGQTNRPAPLLGLECDKLDRKALDAHFREFTAKLLADVGPHAGRTLVATHVDSWEVGGQNWTRDFRDQFRQRRGYDPLRYLPVMQGRVVNSLEVSERFLWDLRQTVSEMIAENHGRHMQELARQHGLWLSIEPYDMTPCDDMTFGATADVPMCEFWSNTFDTRYSVKEATSIAHVYGKPVVAAEAFTSTDGWLLHPAGIKALGDWAFCEGVNRFVIHRYVHQPFLQIRPGLSLGPHGVHYERTQTWWELTRPWHEYLARCQHVLQQGRCVADILYLSPEGAPNVFQRPNLEPTGYKYDACTPEALLTRVRVQDGQLVLPDGATYRVLVLPDSETMTPPLLRKIEQLAGDGATLVGTPPSRSPSLTDYPACDAEVKRTADELWTSGEIRKGKPAGGESAEPPAPATIHTEARWIWHREGNPAASAPVGRRHFRRVVTLDADMAIQSAQVAMTADNSFELWVNARKAGGGDSFHVVSIIDVAPLLKPGANVLAVVAENGADAPNPAGLIGTLDIKCRDGRELLVHTDRQWLSAVTPVENWRTAAMTAAGEQAALELGALGMPPWGTPQPILPRPDIYPSSALITGILGGLNVPPDFEADQPLRYTHRQFGETDVYFVSNGEAGAVEAVGQFRVTGRRPELRHPETGQIRELPSYSLTADGRTAVPLRFESEESYFVVFRQNADGGSGGNDEAKRRATKNFPESKPVAQITGPWQVTFDPRLGGPQAPVTFEQLDDWSKRVEEGVRHYSGTAVYTKTFELPSSLAASLPQSAIEKPKSKIFVDLGAVHEFAQVRLNGRELGIAWRRPFRLDVTEAVRDGVNELQVRVTNLWPNRLIGDESLPSDSDRSPQGILSRWPQWLLEGKPSPTGRYTFATWRDYRQDSPLLPSGLLGPVTIQVVQTER